QPPGLFPAAYLLSAKSQVSGKKSMPSRGWAEVAVTRTIVSPPRTVTDPLACLASEPVSNTIGRPPTSAATRCTDAAILASIVHVRPAIDTPMGAECPLPSATQQTCP